jgi:hypothetical protein
MDKERVIELLEGVADGRFSPATLYSVLPMIKRMKLMPEVGRGRPKKYPLDTMEVGTTFDIEADEDQPKISSLRSYLYKQGAELGRRFMCHQYPDGLIQVYRKE